METTPTKTPPVMQVPSSSPAAGSDPRAEMRKRFHSHRFWPIISKRFYYLTEPELFKAMVKGKGNLRDISQWLADNIPLAERLQQYDAQQQHPNPQNQQSQANQNQANQNQPSQPTSFVELPPPNNQNGSTNHELPGQVSAIPVDDEDASPVKVPGKARQKRSLPSVETRAAPDTKVQLQKPKVSILEKYRNRQPKIEYMFQKAAEDPKRRRLVRADSLAPRVPLPVSSSPGATVSPLPLSRGLLLSSLGAAPRTKVPFDELDLLEQKIKANRLKKKRHVESDAELEDEVFSDDMLADEGTHYGGFTSMDGQILEFLNNAPKQDLVEICNIPPAVADKLVGKRPVALVAALAEDRFEEATPEPEVRRRGPRKTMGLKIVESTEFSLKGYKAVDSLVKQCSEYGDLIFRQMARWGVNVSGDGELDVVDVDVAHTSKGDTELPYIKDRPELLGPDVELKNYQQVGINWLNMLYHNKLSCILADEMGLGKTCQVIAFMAHLKAQGLQRTLHLVVVPSSTLENWLREFHKFCPSLVVQAYYGLQAEREDLRYELAETQYDVLVTTYNLATGAPADFKFLKHQNFDMIVYDEGHMLKNSNSERYNKLMRLKAGFRLLLTGTPLQNNLKELVSLLAFMLPGLFVEKREDLQGLFNKKASVDASGDYNPLLSQQAINKAKTMLTPFVLRRRKAQVLKYLPEKSHAIIKCAMTPSQREIYDTYIQQGKATRAERERRKGLTGKEADEARNTPIATSLNVMMSLRKAAMHPLLFRRKFTDQMLQEMSLRIMGEPQYVEANRAYILEDMQIMSDYELNGLCEKFPRTLGKYVLDEACWHDSGKAAKLMEIIRDVMARGEKVLVFSLFTQMLDILEKVFSFALVPFLRLDGLTSVDTRQDIIDRFYEDGEIPVFLLLTKAGGFGINLIAANNVVIFDQLFNPHDDKQAEDRAHRVGQTKEVMVTKLISENTIDENILMLAENKLQLDQSISADNETKFEEQATSMFEKLLF